MKKIYCFHCQKEIEPINLFGWHICPRCFHYSNDDGEGFYLVCDNCGANVPTDAKCCVKCGHGVNGHEDCSPYEYDPLFRIKSLLWGAFFLFIFLISGVAILYISWYLIGFFLFFGLIYWLVSMLANFGRYR